MRQVDAIQLKKEQHIIDQIVLAPISLSSIKYESCYPLVIKYGDGKFPMNGSFTIGKSLINGSFSIAMFDYGMVNHRFRWSNI